MMMMHMPSSPIVRMLFRMDSTMASREPLVNPSVSAIVAIWSSSSSASVPSTSRVAWNITTAQSSVSSMVITDRHIEKDSQRVVFLWLAVISRMDSSRKYTPRTPKAPATSLTSLLMSPPTAKRAAYPATPKNPRPAISMNQLMTVYMEAASTGMVTILMLAHSSAISTEPIKSARTNACMAYFSSSSSPSPSSSVSGTRPSGIVSEIFGHCLSMMPPMAAGKDTAYMHENKKNRDEKKMMYR
mmetsp:Transcript_125229/g.304058  ORF Transcript_125229/g.304058 Transcript_125229/m.304058 type:complete len:243 (-) Transcript_125229:862-1590(-)